ncbi:MAG TPA: DHA2 family efflux MFS transporter permease subunit [Methanomassiliicoccales archaeon]|jgi:EmrB/QacA subfamily drug resistance transporter
MANIPETDEGRKDRYLILVVVLAGVFMSVLDGVVVTIALPSITSYFRVGVAESQWVVTTYPVIETAFIIIFGKVAERTGKAKMFTGGLVLFTVSSLMCGVSGSLELLILFRVVQGMGAAMLFCIAAAILFQVFRHEDRGKVMGLLGSAVAVAMLAGPAIGGFIVGGLGWQYIFWINVPVGVFAAALAFKTLRLNEMVVRHLRMDYAGSVLWIIAIVTLMLTLGEMASAGEVTVTALAFMIAFALSLIGFTFWEKRAPYPLLDISVFRVRAFTFAGLSMAMFFISSNIVSVVGPFYYEGVLGYGPETVGLIFMILPAVMIFGSPITGRMYDRTHSRHYSPIGQIIRAGSLFLLALGVFWQDLITMLLAFAIMGGGSALFKSVNDTEVMITLPKEKAAVASSVSATFRNLSIPIGTSLGTMLLVFQMGKADLTGTLGSELSSNLTAAATVSVLVAGSLSLAGAVISYLGNRRTIEP